MIPAVQDLLVDKFGTNRVSSKSIENDNVIKTMKRNRASESEVLTSIVRGLAVIGCRDESLIDDVVDSDYGAWDDDANEFFSIIEKGTPIKETALDKVTFHGKCQEEKGGAGKMRKAMIEWEYFAVITKLLEKYKELIMKQISNK